MAKKTKDTKQKMVINQVVVNSLNRQSADVEKWRNYLKAADNGRPAQLFKMFEDILLDPILSDAIDKRIQAITNADLSFMVNDQEVDEINDLMETAEWENLLEEIMLAIFWGITVLELDYTKLFEAHSFPRTHIRPRKKMLLKNENDDIGIPYENDPFFLEIKPKKAKGREGFGLILKASPYAIYKRGGFGDWAQFVELFGMPTKIGKYNANDEPSRLQLIHALNEMGGAASVVVPKDSDIELKESKTNSNGLLHNNFRKACNEEMLICILGQTMTTVQGDKGARSLGEVHMEVQESKHAADRRFVARILNHELLPRLEARGFKVSGGKFVFPELGQTLTLKEQLDIDEKLDKIIEIDGDYFYEKYKVEKPKDGGGKKSAPKPPEEKTDPPTKPKKKDKRDLSDPPTDSDPPKKWQKLWTGLADFFLNAPAPIMESGATGGNLPTPIRLSSGVEIKKLDEFNEDELLRRIWNKQSTDFDHFLYRYTANQLLFAFREGWKQKRVELTDIAFDYGLTDEVVQTMMELNLFHFSASKTIAEIQQLNSIFRKAKSFNEFATEAKKVTNVFNRKWLETEYNTAFLTAESSSTYHRLKSKTDLFPYWEYRTVGDGKVRHSHAMLNGLVLPANDPRWQKILPPNDWNCRCYIVPRTSAECKGMDWNKQRAYADNYLKSPAFKKAKAQGFGVNRAELKQVFTSNQMYLKKFPNQAAKHLNNLTYKDWALQSTAKLKQAAGAVITKYSGTAEAWKEAAEKIAGDIRMNDYNNRGVILTERNFKAHTTGKKAERVKYLNAMRDSLRNPDEIWLNGSKLDDMVIISYHKDEVMIVLCKIENGTVNHVKTWFPMHMRKEIIDKYRRGLLIKKSD